jgi:hypothetical protein
LHATLSEMCRALFKINEGGPLGRGGQSGSAPLACGLPKRCSWVIPATRPGSARLYSSILGQAPSSSPRATPTAICPRSLAQQRFSGPRTRRLARRPRAFSTKSLDPESLREAPIATSSCRSIGPACSQFEADASGVMELRALPSTDPPRIAPTAQSVRSACPAVGILSKTTNGEVLDQGQVQAVA